MRERRISFPFSCPNCGKSADLGIRVGGLFSQNFRCEGCDAYAIARGYLFFSALYGAIIVALAVLCLGALDLLLGAKVRFEYFLVIVGILVIGLIWLSAARYWKLVIRWTKADSGG
jgi:hypothetical protein